MKLELKHLAPYLPYGLKGNVFIYSDHEFWKNEPLESICLRDNILSFPDATDVYLESTEETVFKPILRPLSDLGRYNDEVIINEHYINSVLTEIGYNQEYGVFSYYKGEIDIELAEDSYLRYDKRKMISYKCIQKITELLYEGHYDVFGLIQEGLAIDMNTIK